MPGQTGPPGQSVVGASEPPGLNCTFGGVSYTSATGVDYVCDGAPGPQGQTGETGPQGPGGIMAFGYFYALMPDDNAATIGVGVAVEFPNDGALSGITRIGISESEFLLAAIGTYEVFWQVSINEPGQLVLGLNNVEQAHTLVGRATGTSQLVNQVLLTTTVANSILTVRNPVGNSTALTMTPVAGGTRPVSASLVIKQIR